MLRSPSNSRVFLAGLLLLSIQAIHAQSWLSGYEYRKEITLDGTQISGSHTDFPILYELASDAQLAASARTDGYDIVFTDDDGVTMLDHELMSYTSGTGAYRGYVKADLTNATDKTIYMYYGNNGASTNPSSTNTWDGNFQAVLHLQESGNGTTDEFIDSSPNGIHGTGGGLPNSGNSGSTPTQATGKFGSAQDFDGTDDRIRLQAIDDDSWTAFTVQVWVNPDDTGDDRIFGKCWGTGTDDETWLLRQTGGVIGSRTNVNNGGVDADATVDDDDNPVAYNTGTWYLATYTWDASDNTVRVYLNGTEVASGALTGSNLTLNAEPGETNFATIGNIPGGGRDFDGQLQEARVSNIARSANWILTQFNIEDDPTGFVTTVGTEEQCGSPVPEGGTASADESTIRSGESTTITLTGNSTTPLQWQSSTDNISYSDIGGQTGATLNTGVLTATTYYRVKVGSASCQVLSTTATVTVLPPFASGYCYRKKVTIDSDQVSGTADLSNFPLLVSLTDPDLRTVANNGNVEDANGHDITFTTSDGTTGLNHEIISYTATTGAFEAWVNVPTVSYNSDTDIYIYYGNSGVSGDPSTTATWNSDYVAVWHLEEDPNGDVAGSILDATSNNNDGQPQGTMTTVDLVAGQIGNAIDLDGTDDYITVPDAASLRVTDNTITLSAWVDTEGDLDNDEGFILKGANNDESYMLGTNDAGASNEQIRGRINNSGNNFQGGTVPTTSWAYAVVVYDGSNVIGYVNGVQQFSNAFTTNIDNSVGEAVLLGTRADLTGTRFFEGILDELRISEAAHTAGWVATEYNNQSSPSTFYTFSDEEYPHDGGTATASSSEIDYNTSTTITLTDHESGGTIQWQSSTDNVTFSDVGGEISTSLNTGNLTATTYYRAEVTDSGCEAFSTTATVTVQPDYLSGYCYRKKVIIDVGQVSGSSNLTNFPMLFSSTDPDLRTTTNNGQVTSTSGYDIKFTDASGTELDHEIESYTEGTGNFIAWVRVPTVSATENTVLYMHYGNSSVVTDPSVTSTWDSNYKAIWHFEDDLLDATTNNNDGTEGSVGSTDDEIGVISHGRGFTGVNNGDSWISVANSTSIDTDISNQVTLEAWARYYLPVPQDAPFIMKSPSVNQERYMLGTDGGTNPAAINQRVTTGSGHFRYDNGSVDADWHHFVLTYDADLAANPRLKLYVDGVLTSSNNADGNILSDNTNPLYIGRRLDNRRYRGVLDELRISNTARTQDWITTEYNNQSDTDTFYALGTEDYNGSGGIATADNTTIDYNTSASLTLTGESGTIQWQSSTDNSAFSDVGGATSNSLNTGNLTTTTYFRAEVDNGSCIVYSNTIQITVRPDFLSDYSFRKKITIDNSQIAGSSDHTDFALLFSTTDIDLAQASGKVQDANGYDIIFALADGTTLDFDIEKYDGASGEFIAWIRIPTLLINADTELFMYYGNCNYVGGDPSVTATYNANYLGVYHFNDDLGVTSVVDDRTGNANDGTANGTMNGADVVTGQIGDSFDFDGTDDFINLGTAPQTTGAGTRTIELWAQVDAFDDGGVFQGGTIANDFSLHTDNGTNDNWHIEYNANADEFTLSGSSSNWHHYALAYDGSIVQLYYDGVLFDNTTAALTTAANNLEVARWNANLFDGLIDEVKVSDVARSSGWIQTEYNNQSDPDNFYNIGAETAENRWTGGNGNTNWNEGGNWSFCSVPVASSDILIPSGLTDYPVLDQSRTIGILNIETGASLDLGGFTLTMEGDFINDGTLTTNGGTIEFSGSAEQDITGTTSTTFHNVVVNKSTEAAELRQTASVGNQLTLTAGNLSLNDNNLTIQSSATISGGSSTAFIVTDGSGELCQNDLGSGDGTRVFPIGPNASSYNPVSVNNVGTSDDFCARVVTTIYSEGQIGSGTQLTSDAIDRTWFVDEGTAGGSDVTLTIEWDGSHELADFDRTDMFISHYNGMDWEVYGSGISASGSDPYAASVSGVNSFSPVGGGSSPSPLPVELKSFTAQHTGRAVELVWVTVSEQNNDYFTVERSLDGEDFESILKTAGAGNSNSEINYQATDIAPYFGTSYYRLSQTDFDGSITRSSVVRVSWNLARDVIVYPNPNKGSFRINLSGIGGNEIVPVSLHRLDGSKLHDISLQADANGRINQIIQTPTQLTTGVYFLNLNVNGSILTYKVVVE
ncbi:DUF2341 domain-containing protein [Ekhidna sp.]|jgi:hypothetical protein|uniref:DUF2341 domain-containing protein n=1 Tax=Ekhidna sp. TaxID=2608089 RepID=UPI0032EFF21F